jgi:succinyl-diaminopimelate desuccinylase
MKALLEQLVAAAPTVENGELRAAEALTAYFARYGLTAETEVWDGSRANVVVHVKAGQKTTGKPLLIAAHLDVVPASADKWTVPPFTATERDGRIYGRGSTDMLGGIAAVSKAIVEVAGSQQLAADVIFAATAGEETDSCGVKRFVEQYRSRFADPVGIIVPEPTDLNVMRAHRGILWLKITAYGRTAHGSMPHLGINAILKINALLNRLSGLTIPHTPHPLLGGCSMSVNRIAGGTGTNIVPETCAIEIDIRTLPGQSNSEIIAIFEKLLAELAQADSQFKADISVLRIAEAVETHEDNPFVKAVCKAIKTDQVGAVGFTTDGPYFAPLGPVLIFGPGRPELCHQPDEYIEIAALEKAKAMYKRIMTAP